MFQRGYITYEQKKIIFEIVGKEVLGDLKKASFRQQGKEVSGAWRWKINGIHGTELVRVNSPFNKPEKL